jgi:hypothetical protein
MDPSTPAPTIAIFISPPPVGRLAKRHSQSFVDVDQFVAIYSDEMNENLK